MPELSLRGSGSGSAQRVEVSEDKVDAGVPRPGPNTARESGTGRSMLGGDLQVPATS